MQSITGTIVPDDRADDAGNIVKRLRPSRATDSAGIAARSPNGRAQALRVSKRLRPALRGTRSVCARHAGGMSALQQWGDTAVGLVSNAQQWGWSAVSAMRISKA